MNKKQFLERVAPAVLEVWDFISNELPDDCEVTNEIAVESCIIEGRLFVIAEDSEADQFVEDWCAAYSRDYVVRILSEEIKLH